MSERGSKAAVESVVVRLKEACAKAKKGFVGEATCQAADVWVLCLWAESVLNAETPSCPYGGVPDGEHGCVFGHPGCVCADEAVLVEDMGDFESAYRLVKDELRAAHLRRRIDPGLPRYERVAALEEIAPDPRTPTNSENQPPSAGEGA